MLRPSIFSYAPELAVGLVKRAEDHPGKAPAKKPVNSLLHAAKVVGMTGLGIGVGTGIGLGLEHAVGAGYKHFTGKELPESVVAKAAPFVGAGMGLLYGLMQAKHTEEMRRGIPHYGGFQPADRPSSD